MKKGPFKMRSGNKPSIAKMAGVSPMKNDILSKIKNRVSNSYGGRTIKGIKNVLDKRGEKFRYNSDGYTYESGSGVIPVNKFQAKRIAKNFKTGYNRTTR